MVLSSPPEKILLTSKKRNVLVGKICLFCIGLAVVHMVLDASQGLYESVAVDFIFGLIIAIALGLNHFRFHRTSKIFVLVCLNVLFLFFSSVLPRGVGIYLYYFPLMVASSALFDPAEKFSRYFFNILPAALLGILISTDFGMIRGLQFESPENHEAFFALNAFSSAAITIICVNFMQKLNAYSERELKELAEEVKGKNTHLEKTNAELDRFLYSTSHDLRSPLSSIKGLVNIASLESKDDNLLKYFSMMIDRVDKLDFFIKDIIDYSKNARTDVRMEPIDFRALVSEVSENLKFIEGADAIAIKSDVEIPQPVNADKNRLSIVLNNLLANAIKYHDPAKDEQWIDVSVRRSNGHLQLTVSDNGMGIDPEHQPRIFEMFYRGTYRSQGSGLGLYIVKETLNKMQGTIEVESTPGQGSSFVIKLPAI